MTRAFPRRDWAFRERPSQNARGKLGGGTTAKRVYVHLFARIFGRKDFALILRPQRQGSGAAAQKAGRPRRSTPACPWGSRDDSPISVDESPKRSGRTRGGVSGLSLGRFGFPATRTVRPGLRLMAALKRGL